MLEMGDDVRRFISYLIGSEERRKGKKERKILERILRKGRGEDHTIVNRVSEQEDFSIIVKMTNREN